MNYKTIIKNNITIDVFENGSVKEHYSQKEIKFHTSNGYLRCRINNKNIYLHRLIAECFLPTFDKKLSINHIDGNKQNNDINNLESISLSANTKHAHRIGITNNTGVNNTQSKLTDEQAKEIFSSTDSCYNLSKRYNISIATISLIRNKKKWLSIHN